MNILKLIVSISLAVNAQAQQFSAGRFHSLFICNDGVPMACGLNFNGQLGDGTTNNKFLPVQINSLKNLISVSGGDGCSHFLKKDGSVWACGYNFSGQLGDGTLKDRHVPVKINSLSNIVAISSGSHALFLKSDSTVWACGDNVWGTLGDGTDTDRTSPVKVKNLSGIVSVVSARGGTFSLFLKSDGTVWACGNNFNGQLGNGTSGFQVNSVPVKINSLKDIKAIAAGSAHSLFLKNDGTVWGCGYDGFGQLASGTNQYAIEQPLRIGTLTNVIAISAGSNHSLFLKNDGTVWACGYNEFGQLGDGTTKNKNIPIKLGSLNDIERISTGENFTLFQKTDGTILACGENEKGELGNGTTSNQSTPVLVKDLCLTNRVENYISRNKVAVFSNPFSEKTRIEFDIPLQNASLNIFDIYGKKVRSLTDLSGDSIIIYRENLISGAYFFSFSMKGEAISVIKYMITD